MRELEKEGVRERERSVKQPSGSKVHRPFTSAKGAAWSSWLSTFCDKKVLAQESPLSALPQDWRPRGKGQPTGCVLYNPGVSSKLARAEQWYRLRAHHVPPNKIGRKGYRMRPLFIC